MKNRIYLCLAATLLSSSLTFGQNKKFQFGVLGGIQRTYSTEFPLENFQYHQIPSQDPAVFGLDIARKIGTHSSIRLQPNLSTFSGKVSEFDFIKSVQINLKWNTLRVPLIFQYEFMKKKISPFIHLGFSYNSVLNNSSTSQLFRCGIAGCIPQSKESLTPENNYNTSVLGGIGANISVGKVIIPIAVRYEDAMTPFRFSTDQNSAERITSSISTRNLTVLTGITF